MTEKYVQLMEDLQYSKRQMQNWKQKHIVSEQQLQIAQQQNQELKKLVERLQQNNSKLTENNRHLSSEKESMITEYSTEISTIKDQISKKQRQINQLKQTISPSMINQDLAIRQLKFELSDEYTRDIESKNKKIEQLTTLLQKLQYEREIEKQKSTFKIQSLQSQIKQLQLKHDNELLQYTNKIFKQTTVHTPEERELLRRTKRQNQQLRRKLQLASADLSTTLQQKNQIHKDYSKWMKEHQKSINQHQNQIQTYKTQINRLNEELEKNLPKKDQLLIKDKERDIKKLKSEAQELRDQILSKQKKISQLEVEKAKIQSEMKIIRSEQDRMISKVQETTQWERQKLQKQLNQTRTTLERIKTQNIQLNQRIFEVNRVSTTNKLKFQDFRKQQEQYKAKLKRQLSQQALTTIANRTENNVQIPQSTNENFHQIKQLEEALKGQQGKLRQFLAKYIQLKRKYEVAQKKLKKANKKIMELLQTKIALGSPKASSKHFEFPTQSHTQVKVSPPKHDQRQNINNSNNRPIQLEKVVNNTNGERFTNTGDFHAFHQETYSKTNPVFNRKFLSPQQQRHIRIQDASQQSNGNNYYQRSLKIKNQRFRELKCTNHDHDQHSLNK